MKKFNCRYLNEKGQWDRAAPHCEIEANSAEEAAHLFSEKHPNKNATTIRASTADGLAPGGEFVNNWELANHKWELANQRRLESLQKLHSSVERADGNLAELSCSELDALVENLKDFPDMDETVSAEERAVREELYKVAFLNRNLQAGLQSKEAGLQTKEAELQTKIQRELLAQLKSALKGQPAAGAAGSGKSNLAAAAALGGMVALQKLNQIEENTGDVSEGLGFD